MKTFFIKTLGCKVNQCDSQEIRQRFLGSGWQESGPRAKADICVVNTCCVTHHADRKSRQAIRRAAASGQYGSVVVTGCYVNYQRRAVEKIRGADGVFGSDRRDGLYSWLNLDGRATIPEGFANHTRAFLKIQEGCDNLCSYCVVPLVRGRSRSKPLAEIREEAAGLLAAGHKEIVLTGVCLGAFGRDATPSLSLVDVIDSLEHLPGLERLRLSSIESSDVTLGLIERMADSEKICPHLHIPFQSGDDGVLRDMNKRQKADDCKRLVEKAKRRIKDLAITCDFIVGFPGETEAAFRRTLAFLDVVEPLRTHLFTFSPRQGTALWGTQKKVDPAQLKERFQVFKAAAGEASLRFRKRYLGREVRVLFEESIAGVWEGYSRNYMRIDVFSDLSLRNIESNVRIVSVDQEKTRGEMDSGDLAVSPCKRWDFNSSEKIS